MGESHGLFGARNYFGQSVIDLACGTESLPDRIKRAYDYSLKYVKVEDLSDFNLKQRIETVVSNAQDGENLNVDAARAAAKEIVEIAFLLSK